MSTERQNHEIAGGMLKMSFSFRTLVCTCFYLLFANMSVAEVVIGSAGGKTMAKIDLDSVENGTSQSFELYAGIKEIEANSGEYLTTFRVSAKGKNHHTGRAEYVSCQVSDKTRERESGAKSFDELLERISDDTNQYTMTQGNVLAVRYGKKIHDCFNVDAKPIANTRPIIWKSLVRVLGVSHEGNRVQFSKENVSSIFLQTDKQEQSVKVFSIDLTDGDSFSCKFHAEKQFNHYFDKTGFTEPKTGAHYSIYKNTNGWCKRSFVSKKSRYLVQLSSN